MKKVLFTFLFLFILGFFILPNIVNTREKHAFSSESRITLAQNLFPEAIKQDSIKTSISTFFDRQQPILYLLGKEYRELWNMPVAFPVWQKDTLKGGLKLGQTGGGDQTISVDITSKTGENYTLRSVNKDQSRALFPFFRYTLARPVIRDQASSMNPYAAPIVADLAEAAGFLHTNPVLYYIPYNPAATQEENDLIAGRIMLMEEEPDSSWDDTEVFGKNIRLLDTKEMMEQRRKGNLWVDTLELARCRIFDVVIGDWDRHENQWEWAWNEQSGRCRPIPVDRDMAFFDFRGGIIDKVALLFLPKLQSFERSFPNLKGYTINGELLDHALLVNLSSAQWSEQARALQTALSSNEVKNAFHNYPHEVREQWAQVHQKILLIRLEKADTIASFFYDYLH
jgi:hypothetical protein